MMKGYGEGAAPGYPSGAGGDAPPSSCTACGGAELRLRRRPIRARFGGQEVRLEVASYECQGCGELHYGGVNGVTYGGAR